MPRSKRDPSCYLEPVKPQRRHGFLLASLVFLACSVELAPLEEHHANAGGSTSTGGTGGASGSGAGAGAGGLGGSGNASPTGGSAGAIGGASGSGAGGGGLGGAGGGVDAGAGTGGGGFVCADPYAIDGDFNGQPGGCYAPDPFLCLCEGCDSPVCDDNYGVYADCVCPVCWGAPFCSPQYCFDNGLCDPLNEGCECADCWMHPACAGY